MSTELLRPSVLLIFSSQSLFSCKHTCQAHSLASSAFAGIGITRRFCKINAAYREGKHKSQQHCHLLVNKWKCMLVDFSEESAESMWQILQKTQGFQTPFFALTNSIYGFNHLLLPVTSRFKHSEIDNRSEKESHLA